MSDWRRKKFVSALSLWDWCDRMHQELDIMAESDEGKDSLVALTIAVRRELTRRVADLIYDDEEPLETILQKNGLTVTEEP